MIAGLFLWWPFSYVSHIRKLIRLMFGRACQLRMCITVPFDADCHAVPIRYDPTAHVCKIHFAPKGTVLRAKCVVCVVARVVCAREQPIARGLF